MNRTIDERERVRPWNREGCGGHYQCRSRNSERLCRLATEHTGKKQFHQLQDINIALLQEHCALEANPWICQRAERVMQYLAMKKDNRNAVFDTRVRWA